MCASDGVSVRPRHTRPCLDRSAAACVRVPNLVPNLSSYLALTPPRWPYALCVSSLLLERTDTSWNRFGGGRRPGQLSAGAKGDVPGFEFAGVVESAGSAVTHVRVGDEVFGMGA